MPLTAYQITPFYNPGRHNTKMVRVYVGGTEEANYTVNQRYRTKERRREIKKNVDFWDVVPCGSCKNRRFGERYRLVQLGEKSQQARNNVSSNYQLKYAAKKCSATCFSC
jgi:hypothetical protein